MSRRAPTSSRICSHPEDVYWYEKVRNESAIGIAMGELFVNRVEWLPLVKNRWIDFTRAHISAIGGLTMARKMAQTCEFYNVRTSWHGPNNVSPIGHAVNLHLDLALYNFGIGEGGNFSDQIKELFPGVPEIRGGCSLSERSSRPRCRHQRDRGCQVSADGAGLEPWCER